MKTTYYTDDDILEICLAAIDDIVDPLRMAECGSRDSGSGIGRGDPDPVIAPVVVRLVVEVQPQQSELP